MLRSPFEPGIRPIIEKPEREARQSTEAGRPKTFFAAEPCCCTMDVTDHEEVRLRPRQDQNPPAYSTAPFSKEVNSGHKGRATVSKHP